MSLENEQAIINDKKVVKKIKQVRVLSILAFALSLSGILLMTLISILGTFVSFFASMILDAVNTSGAVGWIVIIVYFAIAVIFGILEIIASIICFGGLAFSIVSLILNGKVKDHTSTIFGTMSMPFAVFGTLSAIESLLSFLLAIILIATLLLVIIPLVLLVLFIVFGIFG